MISRGSQRSYAGEIEKSFADYYRTTILSSETDPNKLHTLKGELDNYQVYSTEQIDALVDEVQSSAASVEALAAASGEIKAFVTLDTEGAEEQARELTEELARSGPRSPLHGVPVGIKDIVDVRMGAMGIV